MAQINERWLGISPKEAQEKQYTAYITDTTDKDNPKCYVIPEGRYSIGRKDDIPLDIPIETEDLYMSRQHAFITHRKNIIGENILTICDTFTKKNPTHINDRYMVGNGYEYQLYDGDIIEMGYTLFTVHLNPTAKSINPNRKCMDTHNG